MFDMPDEQNPNQLSFPAFEQNAPVAKNVCDNPNCSNQINFLNAFEEDGSHFCPSCVKPCEECEEAHYVGNLHSYTSSEDSEAHLYCNDCYISKFSECPNCKLTVEKDNLLRPNRRNTYSMKQGGCNECSALCNSCNRVVDKDSAYSEDGDEYCEDCHSELFSSCEECGQSMTREDGIYVEDVGEFCTHCYGKLYTTCCECDKVIEKSDAQELNDNEYCEECYQEIGPQGYAEYTQNFGQFTYTKKDKYLNLLNKLLPISVKDLKTKHPSIANGLNDLISLSGGKPLTQELVQKYRQTLDPEDFQVDYTVWDGVQRSVDTLENKPERSQLVINVLASPQMLSKLHANPALYNLFDKVNDLSNQSSHPYIEDQIGWIRVELDPNKEYILVDEIQSDHSNAGFRLKHSENNLETDKIRSSLKHKYNLDDAGLNKLLEEYSSIVKDFPNIASQAVSNFAKQNGFKKIFWHTYESGKALKRNEPPKSLYDKTPKENFFLPSQNKPFGLKGEFFEKEAKRTNSLYKLARSMYLKHSEGSKSQLNLIKLAQKMQNKYASIDAVSIKNKVQDAVQTAVANASTQRNLGIMPFTDMLAKDNATLEVHLTRTDNKTTVNQVIVNPPNLSAKYAGLSDQIAKYLNNNEEVFPTKSNNVDIEYNGLSIVLNYPNK